MGRLAKFSKIDFRKAAELILLSTKNNETYGMIGLDLEGKIQFFNRGAELITGFEEAEVLDKPICRLFTQEDIESGIPELELMHAIREAKSEDQRWHVKKDGSRFWAVGAITTIRDDQNRILGLCKIFHDETVRKNTENGLLAANAELARFAQFAAHDLQGPLRTVTQYLELLLKRAGDELSPKSREYVQIALDAAGRMHAVVTGTLSFTQLGVRNEAFEMVDVAGVLEAVIVSLRSDIEASGATIVRGPLPVVRGIATQIGHVFQNLLSNALKFRARGIAPRVEVTATTSDDECTFTVADNGIGIQPGDLPKLFETFQRLHGAEQFPGSGLGLAICKRIVERHGGRIWATSLPGQGSAFSFTLKRSPPGNEPSR